MASKEYELAIKIAGRVEKSLLNSTGMTKKQLDGIAAGAVQVNKVAGKAFDVMAKAAAVAATAVAGVVAASVKVGSEFEAQMSTVQSISGATGSDFDRLSEKARQMGKDTVFSAQEAGEAFEYMAMAGWKTNQMVKGIDGIMNLAAASGEDLGLVSDIVTDAMTAMGMSAEDSTEKMGKMVDNVTYFADVLAAASSNSNTSVAMMGESFKYAAPIAGTLGFSIDDTAFALGLMANSGIKASQAGTTLRRIMTELSTSMEIAQANGSKFVVETTNADGSMRSLKDILDDTREAFSGVSEAELEAINADVQEAARQAGVSLEDENGVLKDQIQLYEEILEASASMTEAGQVQEAEAIAGKLAMAGMLAMVNATEEDYNKLYTAIENSNGAAEKMASVRMDNLQGDMKLLESATQEAGISIYETMNGAIREGVQTATEYVNRFSEWFNKNAPTIIRHVKNMASSFLDFAGPFINVAKMLLKNPNLLVGTFVGIGKALIAYKIASGVASMVSSIVKLGTPGMIVMAIGAVVTAIAGIAGAIKAAEEAAVNQNLADHFGTISLSLEELDSVAEHVVSNDNLSKIRESMRAMDDLEGIGSDLQKSVDALNKMNFKVGIGMALTEGEMETYKMEIESFINGVQDYVLQQQYAVTLSVGVLLGDDLEDSNIVAQINTFYEGKHSELADLGTQLNEAVTNAFSDGLLEFEEVEKIQEIQAKMAKIQSSIATSNFDAELEMLTMQYDGTNLDAESFQNLQVQINEKVQAAITDYDESLKLSIANANVMLADGAINEDEYNAQVEELKKGYLSQIGEIELKASNFQMDTIMKQYSEELEGVIPEFQESIGTTLSDTINYIDLTGNAASGWNEDSIKNMLNLGEMDKHSRKALGELYSNLEPSMESLVALRDKYIEYGIDVPESLSKGISDMAALGTITGSTDAMWLSVSEVATSPAYDGALRKMYDDGVGMPDAITNALQDKEPEVDTAVFGLYSVMGKCVDLYFSEGYDVNVPINIALDATVPKGYRLTTEASNGAAIKGYATGGIITHPTLATFAEEGPEAAIPLDGSQNAINLWTTAGKILGVFNNAKQGPSFSEMSNTILSNDSFIEGDSNSEALQVNYSPQIIIQGGSVPETSLQEAMDNEFEKFKLFMKQYEHENSRRLFA